MELSSFMNKRWVGYFVLMFVVWYPVTLLLVTTYGILGHPVFLIVGNIFTPLWILLVSYWYFRRARDDWSARLFTATGWMVLMFVLSAALVKPVYGYEWTSVFNLDVINANWINFVAILVGGVVAHRSTPKPTTVEPTL